MMGPVMKDEFLQREIDEFLQREIQRASDATRAISQRLSRFSERLGLFEEGQLYHATYRANQNLYGDRCQIVFRMHKILLTEEN
jgi:hypothetical protein